MGQDCVHDVSGGISPLFAGHTRPKCSMGTSRSSVKVKFGHDVAQLTIPADSSWTPGLTSGLQGYVNTTVVLYWWCHSDSASVLLYFTLTLTAILEYCDLLFEVIDLLVVVLTLTLTAILESCHLLFEVIDLLVVVLTLTLTAILECRHLLLEVIDLLVIVLTITLTAILEPRHLLLEVINLLVIGLHHGQQRIYGVEGRTA